MHSYRMERSELFTLALILVCVYVGLISHLGLFQPVLQPFFIADPFNDGRLTEVMSGELWRLITPIFLHFGLLHLLLNMLLLWQLGGMIEQAHGGGRFIILLVSIALVSNLTEYWVDGPAFGGMSGVLFGLFGYAWIQSQLHKQTRLHLPTVVIVFMLSWFLLSWSGVIVEAANMAHTSGLVAGVLIGGGELMFPHFVHR